MAAASLPGRGPVVFGIVAAVFGMITLAAPVVDGAREQQGRHQARQTYNQTRPCGHIDAVSGPSQPESGDKSSPV